MTGTGSWLFVHITKCGGTSVLTSIREAFPETARAEINGDEHVVKAEIARWSPILKAANVEAK